MAHGKWAAIKKRDEEKKMGEDKMLLGKGGDEGEGRDASKGGERV